MSSDITSLFLKYFTRICIIFLILPIHECAHAFVAKKMGDDTASLSGRITLNPLAHIDIVGAVLLVLTGFGWAKPVPINPSRMKNSRLGISLTALAGPVSNLLAALAGMIIHKFLYAFDLYRITSMQYVYIILVYFISINIGLAVFNLIPVPPLDGDKVLSYFTPYKYKLWVQRYQNVISIVFIVLIFSPILSVPLGYIRGIIYDFLDFITNWIPMIF